MADNNIPGFFLHPKTKKYFREDDTNDFLKIYKLQKKEVLQSARPSLSCSSVPSILMKNQLGLFSSSEHFKTAYYKQSLQNIENHSHEYLTGSSPEPVNVEYIKAGPKSIFGLWRANSTKYPYIIAESPPLSEETILLRQPYKCVSYIKDFCEMVFNNWPILLYAENKASKGPIVNIYKTDIGYSIDNVYVPKGPVNCIEGAGTRCFHFAVGGNDFIDYFKEDTELTKFSARSRAMTVSFINEENCVISGHSNGSAVIRDLRAMSPVFNKKIDDSRDCCLVDSYYVAPNKVIFSSASNKLIMFDTQSLRPIVHFWGHKQGIKKQPISVSNDYICSTGSDNVVRVWLSKGGYPIKEFEPLYPNTDVSVRGCIKTECNRTFLYKFDGLERNVYELQL